MMTNAARGEVEYDGGKGHRYKLCLTLGALAEIESSLGIEDMSKIDSTFEKPGTRHLMALFLALAHGGGHTELTEESLMAIPLNTASLRDKIMECFTRAGLTEEAESEGN